MNSSESPDGSETTRLRSKEVRRTKRLWLRVVSAALSAGLAFACSDPGDDSHGSDAFAETAMNEDSLEGTSDSSQPTQEGEASSDEDDTSNAAGSDRPTALTLSNTSVSEGDTCEGSSVIECKVDLPSQGGVINCFVGLRVCVVGSWSDCLTETNAEHLLQEDKNDVAL